ncbi:hypothetical protein BH23VER1_BH23VER1_30560 [soil metagenome]
MPRSDLKTTRELAWIGDAVLSLHGRRWILANLGAMDGAMLTRFTSNRFLAALGNPTEVEATIGALYESDGYEAACAFIDSEIIPLFRRQEANRRAH